MYSRYDIEKKWALNEIRECVEGSEDDIIQEGKCDEVIKMVGLKNKLKGCTELERLMRMILKILEKKPADADADYDVLGSLEEEIVFYPVNNEQLDSLDNIPIKANNDEAIDIITNTMPEELTKYTNILATLGLVFSSLYFFQ